MKNNNTIHYISKTFLWSILLIISITLFIHFKDKRILFIIRNRDAAISASFSFTIYCSINYFYYLSISLEKIWNYKIDK